MNANERFGNTSESIHLSLDQQKADLANPEYKASIDRVRDLLGRILGSENDELIEAYVDFAAQLPKSVRITHYFIGSTPGAGVDQFDEGGHAVLDRIEAFAKEHGL